MDRLISEKEILKNAFYIKRKGCGLIDVVEVDAIKAIPSAYKGMTNGEVLKVVFPHEDVYKGEFGYDLGGCTIDFDWWNSPYEPKKSEE